MAITAINVSRVSTTLRTESMLSALRQNTLSMYTEQNRLSTGRQYVSASDDPARAARALDLNEILDQQDQLLTNIQHASNVLDATDVAMAEVSDLIIEAQSIATQHIGVLSSVDERAAAAELISSIREQLMVVGNRTYEGRYLFAGRDTDEQPFISALGGIAYVGDNGDITARTDTNELEAINLSGDDLFGAVSAEVQGFVDLNPALSESTRIEDLNGATSQGVYLGSFQIIEEGGAGTVTIDVSNADTIGDIVDIINNAAAESGANFTASITDPGITITPGGSNITIRDASTGTTARDLGIRAAEATGAAVVGGDLGVTLTRTTLISDLNGGAGVNLDDGLVITNGLASSVIDLSGAETIQDILNTINNSGTYVDARINKNGTGIDIFNAVSGMTMTIGENGGTTATELGVRSLHENTLVSDLNNGEGIRTLEGKTDIRVVAKDGNAFEVDLSGVMTIQDILDAINDAATAAGVAVTADLAAVGNGIRLTDATGGAEDLRVERANVSYAIDDIGLYKTAFDPETELVGDDINGAKVNGILGVLQELENALLDNDSQGITIAGESLEEKLSDFNRVRGIVGARASAMEDRLIQTENANFSTESLLTEVRDLDFTEAVTRFQQAQTALQASLLTSSQVMSTTLMDYLA